MDPAAVLIPAAAFGVVALQAAAQSMVETLPSGGDRETLRGVAL